MDSYSWIHNIDSGPCTDKAAIAGLLPHRGHMALLNRLAPGTDDDMIAEVSISTDAFWAAGHFPVNPDTLDKAFPIGPLFPGVLMVESAAQLSICFWRLKLGVEATARKVMLFKQIDKAVFKREVRPGDVLYIRSRLEKLSLRLMRCHCEGVVLKNGQATPEPSFECQIAGMTVDQ